MRQPIEQRRRPPITRLRRRKFESSSVTEEATEGATSQKRDEGTGVLADEVTALLKQPERHASSTSFVARSGQANAAAALWRDRQQRRQLRCRGPRSALRYDPELMAAACRVEGGAGAW